MANDWVKFVKEYAAKNNMKYPQVLKDAKSREIYKKMKEEKKKEKKEEKKKEK